MVIFHGCYNPFFINESKINSLKSVSVHIMLIFIHHSRAVSKVIFCLRALILLIIFLYISSIFWFFFKLFFFFLVTLLLQNLCQITNFSELIMVLYTSIFLCQYSRIYQFFSVSLNSSNTMRLKYNH